MLGMNGESARCTRLSKLQAAFAFRLFFMSPICFLISRNSSSRRAVLSSGPLEDRARRLCCLDEWSGCLVGRADRSSCLDDRSCCSDFLGDWSGRSGCLDDLFGRSGCLDDRVVLTVLCKLGGAELPALSAQCLFWGGVFSTSSSLRRVT
jgi:hypothetical protein